MRCYRYLPFDRGIEALESGRFRLSSVSWFNDPFDCYGRAIGAMSDESCWHLVNRDLERWKRFFIANWGPLPQVINARVEDVVDWVQTRMEIGCGRQNYVPPEVAKEWLIDEQYRLMCFSDAQKYDPRHDILMWSHYADSCRGVRIEFEIEEDDLPDGCWLKSVKYTDKRPVIDLSRTLTWDGGDPEYVNYVRNCVWTKCKAWRYEHEIRLLVDLNKVNRDMGVDKDRENGFYFVYWMVPIKCIKFVTFGFSADRKRIDRLMNRFAKDRKYDNLEFEQMNLSLDDYSPSYDPV